MTRTCGGCTLCCRLFAIQELQKPRNTWCSHCEQGIGCKIYPQRPESCKGFRCGWLQSPDMADRYRPDHIGLFVATTDKPDVLQILVDPDRPMAWKEGLGAKVVDYLRSRGQTLLIIVGETVLTDDR